jgi:hypothetical protein
VRGTLTWKGYYVFVCNRLLDARGKAHMESWPYPLVNYVLSYRLVVNDPAHYRLSCVQVVKHYIIAHVLRPLD